MRILQVNKFHFVKGGAERYVADVSRAEVAAGHEVVPFAMRHARNAETPYARYFPREVDYDDAATRRSLGAAVSTVYSREAERCMTALLDDARPDVAHVHNIAHQLTPSVLRALHRRRVPTVQTLHDYKVACPAYLFLSNGAVCERCRGGRFYEVVRHACHKASRAASAVVMAEAYLHRAIRSYDQVSVFLCPSRFLHDTMARHGLDERKLAHLPYFIPAEEYVPAEDAGDGVLYVGRLSHEKGLGTLLAAMRRHAGHTLTIVGEGPLRAQVEAEARNGQRVVVRGYQQGDALHQAVRAARVVVVPSEWYENLPYAILESFALGRAVVGARIGGIPELVRDGVTGATFRPGDDAECARAIAPYLEEPARALAHGRAARALIEREFAAAPHLEQLFDAYARAAA